MKSRNKLYYFVDAEKSDDKDILEILEEADFSGDISIIYTRRPSAISSFEREGNAVKVLLCKRSDTHELVGFGVCAIRDFYMSKKVQPVAYLSGLRIKKSYRKKFIPITKAYEFMGDYIKDQGVKWVYTTVLEENTQVIKMFSKRRKSMPYYKPIGNYTVYSPTTRLKRIKSPYQMRPVKESELDKLVDFLKAQGKESDFYPRIGLEDLRGETYLNIDYKKFYIVLDSDQIIACGYLGDRHEDKQHILHEYSSRYKLLKVLSPLLVYLGYPKLPKEGSVLKYYNLAFLRVKNNDEHVMDYFIRELAHHNKAYDYFLLGMMADAPLSHIMKKVSKVTYKSRVYSVDYEKSEESEDKEKTLKDMHIECGLL
ncbi:GNAT family N-acetyltransferase [Acidaminobacter sp. JC074]|uniref:hypothetical protein n=1 Tax=Acidaminobacter sp. JC074 TaxID=2530199 RepID=UPI001F10A834|nr:hypothetical protein [Acidaminobacter sp. JC074]MCH4887816.1 GNAT family N-acetyltransferase [Acidaminobacter sp. JC074]